MKREQSVTVTLTDQGAQYTIGLVRADFSALAFFADGQREIVHNEKHYKRLHKIGLVTHKFTAGDWPKAIAVLTGQGEQALAQDPLGVHRPTTRRVAREPAAPLLDAPP
jgi:hypothetical protein